MISKPLVGNWRGGIGAILIWLDEYGSERFQVHEVMQCGKVAVLAGQRGL